MAKRKRKNYYEMSEWEKKRYHQITIEEALQNLGGGDNPPETQIKEDNNGND